MPPSRLSVVLPTYNREPLLRRAVTALLRQSAPPASYEIVVVNNNCTDGTAAMLASIEDARVRVLRETRQGLSHARNAGLAASRAEFVAFTDDDVEVAPDWVERLLEAFDAHPEADGVGGRVMPAWDGDPPGWLTRAHWGPLALQDHGDGERVFDRATPIGLIGANVAFRRSVFERIGGFAEHVQRVKDGIGSTEDHELLNRLYAAGGRTIYSPRIVAYARVQAERLARAYHRRWHEGHGQFSALMRLPETERARVAPLGVPGHLVRSAVADAGHWLRSAARADWDGAFLAELRLRFFKGFVRARVAR